MSKFEELLTSVEAYQTRVTENYDRVRRLATDIKDGFCAYLDSKDGVCVHLVPPIGEFQPRTDLDKAFTIPPRGFRPLGPISFGLAVRVTRGTNWIRVPMHCRKLGDRFTVFLDGGPSYTFSLPIADHDPSPFYDMLYDHIAKQFTDAVDHYDNGEDARSIGFDFSDNDEVGV